MKVRHEFAPKLTENGDPMSILNLHSTLPEKLKKYFRQYGPVQDAVVMKDPVSKRSRGFGFITFADIPSVDNALEFEHTIDSRKVQYE